MLLTGRNCLGWTFSINAIEFELIVLGLIAIPEDGGLQEGGGWGGGGSASVQTREVKNAKENHQGGRITVK